MTITRLHREGKNIVDENGKIRLLRGACYVGLNSPPYPAIGSGSERSFVQTQSDFAVMKGHGSNLVRRVHGDFRQWRDSLSYRTRLEAEIQSALDNDLYYLLSWARWDGTEAKNPDGRIGLAGMPKNLNQWITMWREIYRRFKQYPNFMGNIANEPHTERYVDGVTVDLSRWYDYAEACIRALATEAPEVLTFVPVHNWAHDASIFFTRDLEADTGVSNFGYTAHVYRHFTSEVGETVTSVRNYMVNNKWIGLHDKGYPLLIGEFGANLQNPEAYEQNFLEAILTVMNQEKMSYSQYSWKPGHDYPMLVGTGSPPNYPSSDWRTLSRQGRAWKNSIDNNPENGNGPEPDYDEVLTPVEPLPHRIDGEKLPPDQFTFTVFNTKEPENIKEADLIMTIFDTEYPDEGAWSWQGGERVRLFESGNMNARTETFTIPPETLQLGDNLVSFFYTLGRPSWGYRIDKLELGLRYTGSPPPPNDYVTKAELARILRNYYTISQVDGIINSLTVVRDDG